MSDFPKNIDNQPLYSTDQVRRRLERMEEDVTRLLQRRVIFHGNTGVVIEVRFNEITYHAHVRVKWDEFNKGYAPLGNPDRWFEASGNMRLIEGYKEFAHK